MVPMLHLFRRHAPNCPHRSKGRAHTKCKCPIWADGVLRGERVLRTVKTKDWTKASGIIRDWDWEGRVLEEKPNSASIPELCERYLADLEARGIRPATIRKYRVLLTRTPNENSKAGWSPSLVMFCESEGIHAPSQLDLRWLEAFRAQWKDAPLAAQKKLERLRAFGQYLADHRLWEENIAKRLRPYKETKRPTEPYTREQMTALLAAAKQPRLRALILLERYSGLRHGDAVGLSVDRLQGDMLFLYTAKTGTPVRTKLPAFVVRELAALKMLSPTRWFWTGRGKLETVAGNYRRMFRKLCTKAKIANGHPHRFRDTFAVEMLLAGVTMEQVSVLLGHSSLKVTERHYAPWVKSRQLQLEAAVSAALAVDPLAIAEGQETRLM